MNPRKRLGEMLLEAGVIDETQLKAALGHQRQWGVRIGQALVDLKLATEKDIVGVLARKYGFEVARLDVADPAARAEALKLLPRDFAQRNNVLPTAVDAGSITVAMSDPSNLAIVDEIRFRTGRKVKVCIGGDREIADAVARHYPGEAPVEAIALDLESDDSNAEALHDPFGGGSRDALEAFFSSSGENAGAASALEPSANAAPKPQPPAAQRTAQPPALATAPAKAPPASAPPRSPTGKFPIPSVAQKSAAAASPGSPAAVPQRAPDAQQPVAAPPRMDDPRAELAGTVTRRGSEPRPEPGRPPPGPQAGDGAPGGGPLPRNAPGGGRALTQSELTILDALERLAGGAHAEPDIVKPTQAMAAMIRLLLRKRVVTEQEFLDELSKK